MSFNEGDSVAITFTNEGKLVTAGPCKVLHRAHYSQELWEFELPDGTCMLLNPCANSFFSITEIKAADQEGENDASSSS